MLKHFKNIIKIPEGRLVMFVMVFAFVGASYLILTKAATNNISIEPENGQQSSNVISFDDATASNGKAIQFSQASANCSQVQSTTEMISNQGLEGSYTNKAPSWSENVWGGAGVSYTRVASGQHSGASAQSVTANIPSSSSGVIFLQNIDLLAGKDYIASIWLRSPTSTTVDFQLRQQNAFYAAGAQQRIQLTPNWQQFIIKGGFQDNSAAFLGITFADSGTVVVDDASLHNIYDTNCVASTDIIPSSYIGMHVNMWGNYPIWPSVMNFGTLRLWDTGTTWADIEPQRGVWNWTRLDYYMQAAVAANEEVIYTMGQTPSWASARPNDPKNGAVSEPTNVADWQNYIRTVATRYKGKIKNWEIWNEPDYSGFYTGTPQTLVTLTSTARQTLQQVDPTNRILSPAFTKAGLPFMDKYLESGGGNNIDVVAVHQYYSNLPENGHPFFTAIQDIMDRNGIGSKQIWNTEGAAGSSSLSDPEAGGVVARAYIMQWAWGIKNFNWYTWEGTLGSQLSQSDHTTMTAAGTAYQQIGTWLRGSKMLSRSFSANGTWTVTLQSANGQIDYVVWNENGNNTFSIPTNWQVTHKRDLSGATLVVSSSPISINNSPIMLMP